LSVAEEILGRTTFFLLPSSKLGVSLGTRVIEVMALEVATQG